GSVRLMASGSRKGVSPMTTRESVEEHTDQKDASQPLAMVFADIVGFTEIMSEVGDLAAHVASSEFVSRAGQLQQRYQGRIIKFMGDTLFAVFEDASMAMRFATDLLRSLQQNPVFAGERQITVKMRLHWGTVRLIRTSYGEDVFGIEVN